MSCSENTDSTDCDWDFPIDPANEITRLRAALAKAERDAARYKTVKENVIYSAGVSGARYWRLKCISNGDGDFDTAIDAAMAWEKG